MIDIKLLTKTQVQELNEEIHGKYWEKFHKRKGQNNVFLGKMNREIILLMDRRQEVVEMFDIRFVLDEKEYTAKTGEELQFLMLDPSHFAVVVGDQIITCGKKFDCELVSILVYARTKDMSFFYYFDSRKGIYPIHTCVFERNIDVYTVPERLQSQFRYEEIDRATNLYRLIVKNGEDINEERDKLRVDETL